MVQVKVNESVISLLAPLRERAEVLDDRGTILGYFEPLSGDEDERYRRTASLFNAEEIHRSQTAEGSWSTTEEMLARFDSSREA